MTAVQVDLMDEDGYLVRGTADLTEQQAREAVTEHLTTRGDHESATPYDAGSAAAAVARYDVHIGLYRKIPCVCGDRHRFDLIEARQRGRGVFTGAWLT